MARTILRLLNRTISVLASLALVAAILYSGFALWDNRQIYAAAEDVLGDLAPTAEAAEEETALGKLFRQLKEVNPDIGAWITMPNTGIDYPVVQGENNIQYISTDIYGNFAIVGSIFLDSRNEEDYSDTYNLLHGHNMTEHRMFSDVNLYKDEEFFNENQKGYIYFPTGAHWLQVVSIIATTSGDSWIMNPLSWKNLSEEKILELCQNNALFVSEDGINAIKAKYEAELQPQFVALSTCSYEFTEARTILLTLIDPDLPKQ